MDTTLAPIDVAQHFPFLDRKLIRTPPAVRRALWLVAVGQIATEGEPCAVRARFLSGDVEHPDCPDWIPSAGGAGRTSVVLNQLEERGVLVGYRGRGRRPHLWSFRAQLERWQGFHWEDPAGQLSEVVSECFCRAVPDLVARFPGQSLLRLRNRAKFQLLSRDHITPPGLFLVETEHNFKDRATKSRRPGPNPVDTRDNGDAACGPVLSPIENSSNSLMTSEERDRFARLKYYLEDHAAPEVIIPGSAPERRLEYLAQNLSEGETKAVLRQFDNAAGKTRVPAGAAMLEKMAQRYLPKATSAL